MNTAHHSGYHLTQKAWNDAKKSTRQAMLTAAGHSKNDHYARAFNFLPQYVRDDLINAQARKSADFPQIPAKFNQFKKSAPAKKYWWQEIGG